jgi:hypothetical protein
VLEAKKLQVVMIVRSRHEVELEMGVKTDGITLKMGAAVCIEDVETKGLPPVQEKVAVRVLIPTLKGVRRQFEANMVNVLTFCRFAGDIDRVMIGFEVVPA